MAVVELGRYLHVERQASHRRTRVVGIGGSAEKISAQRHEYLYALSPGDLRAVSQIEVKENAETGGTYVVMLRDDGSLTAFTTTCPHLGCAVDLGPDGNEFKCPCHTSAFGLDGEKKGGPAKRGLDPLPVDEKDGRVLVTFKRFKADIADREES